MPSKVVQSRIQELVVIQVTIHTGLLEHVFPIVRVERSASGRERRTTQPGRAFSRRVGPERVALPDNL
jgi:hypothetical protein